MQYSGSGLDWMVCIVKGFRTVEGYHQYGEGYHQYGGGHSVQWRDIIGVVDGYLLLY